MYVRVVDLIHWTHCKTYFPYVYMRQKREVEIWAPSVSLRLCTSMKERP